MIYCPKIKNITIVSVSKAVLNYSKDELVRQFVFDLVFIASVVGELLGWLVGRSRQAAIAMAIAGTAFAIGLGHNIPFFVGIGTTEAGKMLLIKAAVVAISGLTLGAAAYRLENDDRWTPVDVEP